MNKFFIFIFSLTFFSFLIFFWENYFFWTSKDNLNENIEKTFIDPSLDSNNNIEIISEYNSPEENKQNYIVNYLPDDYYQQVNDKTKYYIDFLSSKIIENKIDWLTVNFHEDRIDVRWKMKDMWVNLYWVHDMQDFECSSVWIHELGHFIDLYFLKKSVFTDVSNYFYNISWSSVKIINSWQDITDFVSGYAMTNKYEDFAESFTYFVLHNDDFKQKSEKSKYLKAKYDFFSNYLFLNKEFIWTDFSTGNKILPYYRDITKISFSLQNFLDFLKK